MDGSGQALDLTKVTVNGTFDSEAAGIYLLEYNFTDDHGRKALSQYRTIHVADTLPPAITLVGGESIKHPLGQSFVDPGFSATDLVDGDVFVESSLYEPGIATKVS